MSFFSLVTRVCLSPYLPLINLSRQYAVMTAILLQIAIIDRKPDKYAQIGYECPKPDKFSEYQASKHWLR